MQQCQQRLRVGCRGPGNCPIPLRGKVSDRHPQRTALVHMLATRAPQVPATRAHLGLGQGGCKRGIHGCLLLGGQEAWASGSSGRHRCHRRARAAQQLQQQRCGGGCPQHLSSTGPPAAWLALLRARACRVQEQRHFFRRKHLHRQGRSQL